MPRPKSGRVHVTALIRPDQLERLQAASQATGISKSVLMEQALDLYMRKVLVQPFKSEEAKE